MLSLGRLINKIQNIYNCLFYLFVIYYLINTEHIFNMSVKI